MGNTRDFVLEMKKSMKLLPTQKFIKGISSYDINYFLHTLSKEYKALGRNIQFTWLKVGRNKSRKHRGFTGGRIEKLVLSRKGQYILFGWAKINNSAHNAFIRRHQSDSDGVKHKGSCIGVGCRRITKVGSWSKQWDSITP